MCVPAGDMVCVDHHLSPFGLENPAKICGSEMGNKGKGKSGTIREGLLDRDGSTSYSSIQ